MLSNSAHELPTIETAYCCYETAKTHTELSYDSLVQPSVGEFMRLINDNEWSFISSDLRVEVTHFKLHITTDRSFNYEIIYTHTIDGYVDDYVDSLNNGSAVVTSDFIILHTFCEFPIGKYLYNDMILKKTDNEGILSVTIGPSTHELIKKINK